jgi:hypothetical protein
MNNILNHEPAFSVRTIIDPNRHLHLPPITVNRLKEICQEKIGNRINVKHIRPHETGFIVDYIENGYEDFGILSRIVTSEEYHEYELRETVKG